LVRKRLRPCTAPKSWSTWRESCCLRGRSKRCSSQSPHRTEAPAGGGHRVSRTPEGQCFKPFVEFLESLS
jgi:hypothetical protein